MTRVFLEMVNNEDLNFIEVINVLVINKFVELEAAIELNRKYKAGERITIDLSEVRNAEFILELDSLGATYEVEVR